MTVRPVICYTCGNSFNVDDSKLQGNPIICPKKNCGAYCYFDDTRELDFVEVLEVKS